MISNCRQQVCDKWFNCSWHFSVFAEIDLQTVVNIFLKTIMDQNRKSLPFFWGGGNRVVMIRVVKGFVFISK